MDKIMVKPARLRSTASSMESTGKEIKNITSGMANLVSGIGGEIWSGEASRSFVTTFRSMDTSVGEMCNKLRTQSEHLNKIADAYDQVEAQNRETTLGKVGSHPF